MKFDLPVTSLLPPYPNGWYLFGFSDEIPPGRLLARPFMGQQVVVFRTRSGQAYAVDAYCPHLGAHFGYGGTVEDELLRCPFHGFCFDGQGQCIRTGYGTKPPPKAILRTWPLRELNGMLFVHYHAASMEPWWELPSLEDKEWTPPIYRRFTLFDHPQETTENSVDIGHFAIVHKYQDVHELRELILDGPYLSTAYAVKRPAPLVHHLNKNWLLGFEFETQIYGLGYSLVLVKVPSLRLDGRLWVLPTSIDSERIVLTLAVSIRRTPSSQAHPFLRLFPPGLRASLLAWGLLSGLVSDARQDFIIWQHKRYTQPPALAQGDGPIGKYRQWARQFYQ